MPHIIKSHILRFKQFFRPIHSLLHESDFERDLGHIRRKKWYI